MNQMKAVSLLVDKGWISLRQLGALLDAPNRSIYGRQKTKNPVATIRIGGIERVYLQSVLIELKRAEESVLISMLHTAIRNKEKEDAKGLRIA